MRIRADRRLLPALAFLLLAGVAFGQGNPNAPSLPEPTVEEDELGEITVHANEHYAVRVAAGPLRAVRQGQPFPVLIEIEAVDRHLRGVLEVEVPGNPAFQVPIDIPAPSLKRVLVTPTWVGEQTSPFGSPLAPAPITATPPADVQVTLRSGSRVRFEQSLFIVETPYPDLIVGEISGGHALLPAFFEGRPMEAPANGLVGTRLNVEMDQFLSGVPGGQGQGIGEGVLLEAGPCTTVTIPPGEWDVADAYAPYDVIALHDNDPREWQGPQIAALQSWALAGGVILAWPSERQSWDPLYPLGLGIEGGNVGGADRPAGGVEALGEFIGESFNTVPLQQRFSLDQSFQPLVIAADGRPLLGVRRYGRGAIVMATVDLSTAAMRDWNGLPLLLSWMGNWGLSHSITEERSPGLSPSTQLIGSMQNFNSFGGFFGDQMQGEGTYERLGLSTLLPASTKPGFQQARPLMGFLALYLALVLGVFPILRRRSMWSTLWGLWALSLVLAAAAVPTMVLQGHQITNDAPIASPEAPTQSVRSETFIATRGSFDGRIELKHVQVPRQLPEAENSFLFGFTLHPMQQRPYLTNTKFATQQGAKTKLEHLELPIWSRRAFFDLGPAETESGPPFEIAWRRTDDAGGGPSRRLEIRALDAEFLPDAFWAAARTGAWTRSGAQPVSGPRAVIDMGPGSTNAPESSPAALPEQRSRSTEIEPDFGNLSRGPQYDGYAQPTDDLARSDIEAYCEPLKKWVELNGGLAICALDFPDEDTQRPVGVRIWYDPTPLAAGLYDVPLVRFGFSSSPAAPGTPTPGVRSKSSGIEIRDRALRLLVGDQLQWSTDHSWTPGERIEVGVRPGSPREGIALDQYVPMRGWVRCPGAPAFDSSSIAFQRAFPTAVIAGDALFRLSATVPNVEILGLSIQPAS